MKACVAYRTPSAIKSKVDYWNPVQYFGTLDLAYGILPTYRLNYPDHQFRVLRWDDKQERWVYVPEVMWETQ